MLSYPQSLRRARLATWKPKYAVGATVCLNANGPVMSVKYVPSSQDKDYTCQWFAGKKLDQGSLKEEQLVPAEPKAPLPPLEDEKK